MNPSNKILDSHESISEEQHFKIETQKLHPTQQFLSGGRKNDQDKLMKLNSIQKSAVEHIYSNYFFFLLFKILLSTRTTLIMNLS